jgi:flagellar motor switch protein FliG
MLTGPEKAVLFLLSLDEDVAGPIVNEMTEAELRKLRAVASTMREVPADALDGVYREFLERSASAVAVPRGGLPYLRRLTVGALGEARANEVFGEGVTSPLARLEAAPPDAVAALLAKEPPQLAGAILARLTPQTAAAVLAAMPLERQAAVIARVGRLTELPAKTLEEIVAALVNELPAPEAETLISIDGVDRAAQILNAAGKVVSGPVLEAIEAEVADLARSVRMAMFTFDDLRRLDARSMRTLLREVPTERLTLALKGAPDPVRDAVFAGLSSRASEMIRDDLDLMGHVRKAEIDRARLEVVEAALRLESEGKIDLGRGDE